MRVAAVGDIHLRDATRSESHELLQDIARHADLLALTGDLTARGTVHEAELLAETLSQLRIPVVGVLGNHDFEAGKQDEIVSILCRAGMAILDNEPCELQGVGFAGVKGFCGGFDKHMLEPWGEGIIKAFVRETVDESLRLESALATLRTAQKFVILHYAPIVDTVRGEPEQIFAFLGSSRLIEPVCRFGATAVFHGHAHRGSHRGEAGKGIPVFNVSLPLMREISPGRPYLVFET